MLELKGVSKRFGGVVATEEVTLEVSHGEVHALIGPNGAGKTTLIGQISGSLDNDSGTVLFEGADITRAKQHERVRAGLTRSYQITSIFKRLTVGRSPSRPRCSTRPARLPRRSGFPDASLLSRQRSPTASSAPSKSAWRSPPAPGSCSSTNRWRAWGRRNRKA